MFIYQFDFPYDFLLWPYVFRIVALFVPYCGFIETYWSSVYITLSRYAKWMDNSEAVLKEAQATEVLSGPANTNKIEKARCFCTDLNMHHTYT